MPDVTERRIWDKVTAKWTKKGKSAATIKAVKVIVYRGRIDIIPIDNNTKFPSLTFKPSDCVKFPVKPKGSGTWISLDFIQKLDAKFNYINFQLDNNSAIDRFLELLHFAWEELDSRSVFRDDAYTLPIAPVHRPPPNAAHRPTATQHRSNRVKIPVDPPEEKAAHGGFNSDFNSKRNTCDAMKEMFNVYGITDKSNEPAPVHTAPHKKESSSSYAVATAKALKNNFDPRQTAAAVKPKGISALSSDGGLNEKSFYGKATSPSNQMSLPRKTPISSTSRMSTKDSVDYDRLSRMRNEPVVSRKKEFVDEDDEIKVNDTDDAMPSQIYPNPQSLTSKPVLDAFDATVKKLASENKPYQRPPPSTRPAPRSEFSFTPSFSSFSGQPSRSLINIGNSCYMNATVQILSACPKFVTELKRAYDSLEPKNNNLIRQFYEVVTRAGGINNGRVTAEMLEELRKCLTRLDTIFEEEGGTAQQDAEECLTALMGMVSDKCTGNGFKRRESGLNQPSFSPQNSPIKEVNESSPSKENEETKEKKKPAVCDPVDLMEVKMRDVKTCSNCRTRTSKDAVEHRVHLGIVEAPKGGEAWCPLYLQQLLNVEAAQEETIGDFKCETCNRKGIESIGTKEFVKFEEYIIIVLKRFRFENGRNLRKLKTHIRVPLYMDMAHFMKEEEKKETNVLEDTIILDKESTVSETLRKGTFDWMEEETKNESQVDDPMKNLNVSGEMNEEEEKKEGEENKEDVKMADATEEVVDVPSSSSSVEVIASSTPSKPRPSPSPSVSSTKKGMIDEEGDGSGHDTPIEKSRHRQVTPTTLTPNGNEKMVEVHSTPVSTRSRKRAKTGREEERGALSASSLTRSEPTKRLKVEPEKRKKKSVYEGWTDEKMNGDENDEVTIVDEAMPPVNPHRKSITPKGKPCWYSTENEKEKRKSGPVTPSNDDAYDFDAEEGEEGGFERTKKENGKKIGQRRQVKQQNIFKNPLKNENGAQKEEISPLDKMKKEKQENVRPFRTRGDSEMEQTGGGLCPIRQMEKEKEEDKRRRNEKEEENGDKEEDRTQQMEDGRTTENGIQGRSKERRSRMKKEGEEGEVNHSHSDDQEEEEVGNDEGRDAEEVKDDLGIDDSNTSEGPSEGVVHGTPPEEMEDEKMEEDKKNGMVIKGEEKEDGEEDADMEGKEGTETNDTSAIPSESAVFDTPAKENGEESDIVLPKVGVDHKWEGNKNDFGLDGVDDVYIGELTPNNSPTHRGAPIISLSPAGSVEIIGEETEAEKKKKKEVKKEEMNIEMREEELDQKRLKRKMTRDEWRKLFIDTDPPPPRDHFIFRPVDRRWMISMCEVFGLEYIEDPVTQEDRDKLRSQSSICKMTAEPNSEGIELIDGDGNCLFRALSWWITATEENHGEVRKKIVEFMFCFPDEFGARMTGDEDGQKYTKEDNNRMLESGEWGTQCELYGAATMLGVDIYTYHDGRWKAYRPLFEWIRRDASFEVTRKVPPNERTRYGIYLTNPHNYHYDAVKYMEPVAPASPECYRLIATLLHQGATAHSGHYIADVYDAKKNQWMHCDDRTITKRTIPEVLESAMKDGYVLVYARNDSIDNDRNT